MKEINLKEIKYYMIKAEKYIKNKETEKALESLNFAFENIKKISRENNIESIYEFEKVTEYELDLNKYIDLYAHETIFKRPTENKARKMLAFIKALKKVFKEENLDLYKARALYIAGDKKEAIDILEAKEELEFKICLLQICTIENNKDKAKLVIENIEKIIEDEDLENIIKAQENILNYYSKINDSVNTKRYTKKLKEARKKLQ